MSIFDKDGRSDPLTCANKQIEVLQEKLAKADERVKELEKELKESEDDLDAAEQQLSSYENALEEVQAVFVDSDACPLFEPFNPRNLSAWLNKFAIEKKIEVLHSAIGDFEEIKSRLGDDIVRSSLVAAIGYFRSKIDQLRKEQE